MAVEIAKPASDVGVSQLPPVTWCRESYISGPTSLLISSTQNLNRVFLTFVYYFVE